MKQIINGHDLFDIYEPESLIDSTLIDLSNNQNQVDGFIRSEYFANNPGVMFLCEKLDYLIDRLRVTYPKYSPPLFSPRDTIYLLKKNLGCFSPEYQQILLGRLRANLESAYSESGVWQDTWYLLNFILAHPDKKVVENLSYQHEVDEWGFDSHTFLSFAPFLRFLSKKYWRISLTGLENVPGTGRALLVANHSGSIPWDGAMLVEAIFDHHPNHRIVRSLYHTGFNTLPYLSSILIKLGQVLANEENVFRLMEQEQLVAVFPESIKGLYKLYKDRYHLARFGRGGFVRIAIKTQTPIIPVSIVGAEETYISLARIPVFDKIIGVPMIPISPTWPWLGLLGLIPLPTKWYIDFGKPISTDTYDLSTANNPLIVSELTELTRNTIQEMLRWRLEQRNSIFC